MKTLLRRSAWCFLLLAALASPVLAQSVAPKDPLIERLPPNTWFYFHWRGTAALDAVRDTNPLCRLWANPALAALRQRWTGEFYAGARRNPKAANLTPQEISELFSLFENPAVVGVIGREAGESKDDKGKVGGFLIFDMKGKKDLLLKLRARLSQETTMPAPATTYAVGPNTVEKIVEKSQTYFQANVGDYYIRSQNIETILELVPRYRAEELPTTSVTQTLEYKQTRAQASAGALAELFARVPNLNTWKLPPQKDFDFIAFARALHLEQIHGWTASLSLTSDATRIHSALVGDVKPGGIFDIFGDSDALFATLPLVPVGASYHANRFNLAALYQLLRRAIVAAAPPERASSISSLDSMASMTLGMSLSDALQLFTGEFASMDLDPSDQATKPMFAITIRDSDKVLDLLRHALAATLSTEDREGSTTFLELAMPYTDPKSGARRRRFYSVAVTPNLVLVGTRKAALRDALTRSAGKPAADSPGRLSDDPTFSHARAALPGKLSGLGFTDLSRINWSKLIAQIIQKVQDAETKAGKPLDPSLEALKQVDTNFLTRYLRVFIDGSWKDANGVYFDLSLQ